MCVLNTVDVFFSTVRKCSFRFRLPSHMTSNFTPLDSKRRLLSLSPSLFLIHNFMNTFSYHIYLSHPPFCSIIFLHHFLFLCVICLNAYRDKLPSLPRALQNKPTISCYFASTASNNKDTTLSGVDKWWKQKTACRLVGLEF